MNQEPNKSFISQKTLVIIMIIFMIAIASTFTYKIVNYGF